jgi:hypothetical protein
MVTGEKGNTFEIFVHVTDGDLAVMIDDEQNEDIAEVAVDNPEVRAAIDRFVWHKLMGEADEKRIENFCRQVIRDRRAGGRRG